MKRLGGLLIALALCGLVAPPAQAGTAQHGSRRDKRGDAPKALDVTKVSVSQTSKLVRATIHVPDLTKRDQASFWLEGSYSKFDGYPFANMTLATWTTKHHHVKARIFEGEDGVIAHCDKLSATWNVKKSFIRVTSARQCDVNSWFGKRFSAYSTFRTGGQKHDTVKLFKVS